MVVNAMQTSATTPRAPASLTCDCPWRAFEPNHENGMNCIRIHLQMNEMTKLTLKPTPCNPHTTPLSRSSLLFFFFFFASSLTETVALARALELGITPSVRKSATNRFALMPAAHSFAPASAEKKKKKIETKSQNN
jgi:hypothetical protein